MDVVGLGFLAFDLGRFFEMGLSIRAALWVITSVISVDLVLKSLSVGLLSAVLAPVLLAAFFVVPFAATRSRSDDTCLV
jgi:hypothetical protein